MQINIENGERSDKDEATGTWLVRHHGEVWHGTWMADDFHRMLLVQGRNVALREYSNSKINLPIDRSVLCDVIAAHLNADHPRD